MIDANLSFLEDRVIMYYAGLDDQSLPFGEGEAIVRKTAGRQVAFLKALSLVADVIVVPPSFYFFWVDVCRDAAFIDQLSDLYAAGIVISPVYESMNCGTDFVDYKRGRASVREAALIDGNKEVLRRLFKPMPVLHRNVTVQSSGFKALFAKQMANMRQLRCPATDRLVNLLQSEPEGPVALSREHVGQVLYDELRAGRILKPRFRALYYAMNRSYYGQATITYDAGISLAGAERYSVLGAPLFLGGKSILLAYDPLVLLHILQHAGIKIEHVSGLTVGDLQKFRDTGLFRRFKHLYRDFAIVLQELDVKANKVSSPMLRAVVRRIDEGFWSRYSSEKQTFDRKLRHWTLSDTFASTAVLGGVGSIIDPLLGFALGFLPVVLAFAKATDKIYGHVVGRLSRSETSFYQFVEQLKAVTSQFDRLAVPQG